VIELGIILALLIGWQFTLAELIGGPIMIVLMAVAFRLFIRQRLIDAARRQADRGLAASMEGHAAMDMSITADGGVWHRLASREGYTSVSHILVMEWAAVIRDIVLGLLIAGAALLVRFFRSGGRQMLAMMGGAPAAHEQPAHG
jgi:uncharacterized protein